MTKSQHILEIIEDSLPPDNWFISRLEDLRFFESFDYTLMSGNITLKSEDKSHIIPNEIVKACVMGYVNMKVATLYDELIESLKVRPYYMSKFNNTKG